MILQLCGVCSCLIVFVFHPIDDFMCKDDHMNASMYQIIGMFQSRHQKSQDKIQMSVCTVSYQVQKSICNMS